MFAQFDNHHHGAPHVGVWLAMPLGGQESLVYRDPKRFFVPPYVGKRGWVGVRLDGRASWKVIEEAVREAYGFRFIRPGRGEVGRGGAWKAGLARTRPPAGRGAPPGPRR